MRWLDPRKSDPKDLLGLLFTSVAAILSGGLATAFLVFALTMDFHSWEPDLCLRTECVDYFEEIHAGAVSIIEWTFSILAGVITLGGVIVALLSYTNTRSATVLGNYLSHLEIFRSFIDIERTRRPLLAPESIDTFTMYEKLFSNPKAGDFEVSPDFIEDYSKLRHELDRSNSRAKRASDPSEDGWARFEYRDHQKRVILALSQLGVKLDKLPRVEYFQIEDQALDLISGVTRTFCGGAQLRPLPKREYV